MSFYIPKVLPFITEGTIKYVFSKMEITVDKVDRVERADNRDGTNCYMAYVHLANDSIHYLSTILKLKKVFYDLQSHYWLCLEIKQPEPLLPPPGIDIEPLSTEEEAFLKEMDDDTTLPEWYNEPLGTIEFPLPALIPVD